MCGYLIYLLIYREYKVVFKITLISLALISPIVSYLFSNIYISDYQLYVEGQTIMAEIRIPHHTQVHSWFSYKDLQILIVIFFALFLSYNNKRLFIPLSFVVLTTIILTIIQYYTSSNFLGLLFPWRSSVYIVPICSMIVLSRILILVNNKFLKLFTKFYSYLAYFFLILIIFFSINGIFDSYKSYKNHKQKYPISNLINIHKNDITRILIPTNLEYIRLNTGLPIFVDWKTVPYRNDALIKWYERIKLTNSFYGATELENQKLLFKKIYDVEQISHLLIRDNNKNILFKNCEHLFKNYGYLFYDLRKCTNLKNLITTK
jgi:hypothetical protein